MAWLKEHVVDLPGKLARFNHIAELNDHGLISLPQFYQEVALLSGVSAGWVIRGLGREMHIDRAVLAILRELQLQQIQTGLLSNSPASLHHALAAHHITPYFTTILTSAEAHCVKPEVAIYRKMLQEMRVDADCTIFVDDRPKNVRGAERAGMRGLVFTDAFELRKLLVQAGALGLIA
jgi:FMN phosphatase YigB (HAD superfamily)